MERTDGNPGMREPIAETLCLAINRDQPGISLIASLDRARRPYAVVGRVIAVVVFSLNRMPCRWAPAHVCDKSAEAIAPTPLRTDLDTSGPIVLVGGLVRVVASLLHCGPHLILRRVGETMFPRRHGDPVFLQATTTLGLAELQRGRGDSALLAAVTEAQPTLNVLWRKPVDERQNSKATEALIGEIH